MLVEENNLLNEVLKLVAYQGLKVLIIGHITGFFISGILAPNELGGRLSLVVVRCHSVIITQIVGLAISIVLESIGYIQESQTVRIRIIRIDTFLHQVELGTINRHSVYHCIGNDIEQVMIPLMAGMNGIIELEVLLVAHIDDAIHHPTPHDVIGAVENRHQRVGIILQFLSLQTQVTLGIKERARQLLRTDGQDSEQNNQSHTNTFHIQ